MDTRRTFRRDGSVGSTESSKGGVNWLREASMKRLSLLVKNKTEMIGNAAQLGVDIDVQPHNIEASGLCDVDVDCLRQWVKGSITGRQCLLAIMDHKRQELGDSERSHGMQQPPKSIDLAPVEVIRSLIDLPQDFLCDSGFLYETVFQHAPSSVIREALQLLVQKAYEKNASSLGAEQINIAIKQLRLENLGLSPNSTADNSNDEADCTEEAKGDDENRPPAAFAVNTDGTGSMPGGKSANSSRNTAASHGEEKFRLQILIELIRMHIKNTNQPADATDSSRQRPRDDISDESSSSDGFDSLDDDDTSSSSDGDDDDCGDDDESLNELLYGYRRMPSFEKASRKARAKEERRQLRLESKIAARNNRRESKKAHKRAASNNSSSSREPVLDMPTIESHLRTPLPQVLASAKAMTAEDLEDVNSLLKPYLKQLSSLKGSLSAQLKELQDSRAYLALGVTADASDEAIKNAYRKLAIRFHPDKPGGDTARFQQLQDAYQELTKKRKSDAAEKAAMDEVRTGSRRKRQQQQQQKERQRRDDSFGATEHSCESAAAGESAAASAAAAEEEEEEKVSSATGPGDCADSTAADDDSEPLDAATIAAQEKTELDSDTAAADGDINSGDVTQTKAAMEEDDVAVADVESDDDDDTCSDAAAAIKAHKKEKGDVDDFDIDELLQTVRDMKAQSGNSSGSGEGGERETEEDAATAADAAAAARAKIVYESEEAHAVDAEKKIGDLLTRIKTTAQDCTQLAQLNIKWQKLLDKAMQMGYPHALKEVNRLLVASTGSRSVLKGKGKREAVSQYLKATAGVTSNQDACALQQAVVPVELICEWAQQIASLSMELPNECGIRYAAAAAGNKTFLAAVERTMHLSLGALKTVLSLIHAQEQLSSCIRRVQDSMKLAHENPEVHDLLLEMIRTGVKSNVVTITNAVDRVVDTALAASEVKDVVQQLRREVDAQLQQEARRRAAEYQSEEMDDDYCEEDREALRKCREDNLRRGGSSSGGGGSNGGAKDGQGADGKDGDGSNNSDDTAHAGIKSLSDLKDKIRMLQVQLKVQHVQALQTMNAEVVGLQHQIIHELKALPFVSSVESLFSEEVNRHLASKKANSSNNSGAATASAVKKSSDSSVTGYRQSVLSLVAELVDSSCHALRSDLLQLNSARATGEKNSQRRQLVLRQHLSWMRIELADASNGREIVDGMFDALLGESYSPESTILGDSSSGNSADESKGSSSDGKDAAAADTSVAVRLALLPDYRAKTLYLASLVDGAAVKNIIGCELRCRMEDVFRETGFSAARDAAALKNPSVARPVSASPLEAALNTAHHSKDVGVKADENIYLSTELNGGSGDDDSVDFSQIDIEISAEDTAASLATSTAKAAASQKEAGGEGEWECDDIDM